MALSDKKLWNSLEVAKLCASILTPLILFWLAHSVNESIHDADEARERAAIQSQEAQQALEKELRIAETKQAAVQKFSRYIYDRRSRSALLLSALRRHADSPISESLQEVIRRKQQYDEAYFRWNSNHQANLLLVRQVLGSSKYSNFEGMVEFRLVKNTFTPIDQCLTNAYDHTIRDGDPRPILNECKASELIQRALDCGYAITDELFRLSSQEERHEISSSIVNSRCP